MCWGLVQVFLASFFMVSVFYDAILMFQEIKEDYSKSLTHYEMALGAIIKLLSSKYIHFSLWLFGSITFFTCCLWTHFTIEWNYVRIAFQQQFLSYSQELSTNGVQYKVNQTVWYYFCCTVE